MVSLEAWAASVEGRYVDQDDAAGNQCWDLSQHWLTTCNGGTLWTQPSTHPGIAQGSWDVATGSTPNTADLLQHVIPLSGGGKAADIVVWAKSPHYPDSHTAVLLEDDHGGDLLCLSQNSSPARPDLPGYSPESTGPSVVQRLPRAGLLGFLRPRATITTQGSARPGLTEMDIDMATPQQVAEAVMLHEITVDGETMRYQDWIVRLVRNTRGTLKKDEILTSFDGTKQAAGIILANAGADVRAIKTKTDRLP